MNSIAESDFYKYLRSSKTIRGIAGFIKKPKMCFGKVPLLSLLNECQE